MRVLELASGLAGAYCGKLLADAGADVVKGEPAGGDPLRANTTLFEFLNTSKRSVVLDGVEPRWDWPDLVIAGHAYEAPIALGRTVAAQRAQRPEVVVVTITPFGCTGPWAEYPANEFTLQAWCGSSGRRGEPAASRCRQVAAWATTRRVSPPQSAVSRRCSACVGSARVTTSTSRCWKLRPRSSTRT